LNLWIFPNTIARPGRPSELAIAAVPPPPPAPAPAPAPAPPEASPARVTSVPAPAVSVVVLFAIGSEHLDEAALRALERLSADGAGGPRSTRVLVEGHADQTGAEQYNQRLSWRRAQAVARWLEALGWLAPVVVVKAYGSSRPAHQGDSADARRSNRRVEINLRSTDE
jgi:OOP family OmpA-OmpF porin